VYAFSECTVPRVTVILRKAFGGAFIAMNSKQLGADFVFAWPTAQLGVMGAPQAEIINRREIEAADDPVRARDALAARYASEHLHPRAATADGYVDEVIPACDTRARVAAGFAALESAPLRRWPAGNIPL
jgi:acetyl-CoA carboxylase carboxyltransferase component